MLFSPPPGQYASTSNRQTLGSLNAPGLQSKPVTPGATYSPYNAQLTPGLSNYTSPSSMPMGSPSSSPAGPPSSPPAMNPYLNSPNRSTLTRVLLGNLHQ